MSDLSLSREALARSHSQLPVSSYFDEGLFREEQKRIFPAAPRYLGHALALPEVGDYLALAQEDNGRALVRNANGVELVSNVCRHRQAVMLQGRGNTGGNIVCPLHRWTYDLEGTLVGAPHFAEDPCLSLKRLPQGELQQWNGLVFEAPSRPASHGLRHVATDLRALGVAAQLDFGGYQFHSARLHPCAYNWKSFIEVYLEDYHVGPFHPGLGRFVACDDLRWEMGRHHSVQTVGVHQALAKPGSEVYQRWHDAVLNFRSGEPPAHGAVWLTLYPTVMVEWYPHVLVVSSLHPRGPQDTLNLVEFFYPEEIVAFEPDFIAAQQAAYMETCVEDDEIALRMDAGRRALMQRGDDEAGPYQSPMEDGMQHFHEWYRREMAFEPAGPAAAPARTQRVVPIGLGR
jgi:phenylpropionate dioxygenase-like ring-hydroxylating dioxygenase large terminal subunit